MRQGQPEENAWDVGEWTEWPDAEAEIDDEEFARAIAEGRELEVAA